MKEKKYTTLDPIRAFYMANVLLKDVVINANNSLEELKIGLEKMRSKVNKMKEKDLIRYVTEDWSVRYDNYFNSSWEYKEIKLEDCGVWPRMGDLPNKFTVGSFTDTVSLVKESLDDKNSLTWSTARVLYIDELKKFGEIINEYIPIIVFEDSIIRKQKPNVLNKLNTKCTYDIDDGNHRAIALALLGKKSIKAFVGKRIYKNDLLYWK